MFFDPRKREPVDVEDGVAYYPNRRTTRAIRQADRDARKCAKLHKHRPLVSRNSKSHADYIYTVKETTQFRRDVKAMRKRGMNIGLLEVAIDILARGECLPSTYRDHPLDGKYKGCRECHIEPDWILIYRYEEDALVLRALRTGTHRDTLGIE